MHLAVFGGSFDPVHHGHLVVATVALEELGADQLRLVPAAEQPFKIGRHRAPSAARYEMVRLAVEGCEGMVADRTEIDRPGPSYTAETLRGMADREPAARISLLLGADAAALFPTWREPDLIRTLADVVVLARAGEAVPDGVADRVVIVPRIDISSTEVRERVRRGRSIRHWVPEPVAGYIASHGLYLEA